MLAEHLVEVSDVLATTTNAAGQVLTQVGDSSDGTGFGGGIETWGVDGFVSRPNTGTKGNCARSLFIYDGLKKRVIGTIDVRHISRAGAMAEGDRCIFTDGPARIKLTKATNTVELYSESGSTPVKVTVDGPTNKVTAENAAGAKLEIGPGNTAKISAAGSSVAISATGSVTITLAPAQTCLITDGVGPVYPVVLMVGTTPTASTRIFGVGV